MLSRTIFGFFALAGLAVVADLAAGLATGLATDFAVVLAASLAGLIGALFLEAITGLALGTASLTTGALDDGADFLAFATLTTAAGAGKGVLRLDVRETAPALAADFCAATDLGVVEGVVVGVGAFTGAVIELTVEVGMGEFAVVSDMI